MKADPHRDPVGNAAVFGKVLHDLRHGVLIAAFTGEQQAPRAKIVHQRDVVMAAPRRGLVDADGRDGSEILLGPRGLHGDAQSTE